MKNKNTKHFYLLLIFGVLFLFFLPGVFAACVVPTNGLTISTNTVLCNGNYFLPNGINIALGGITLDCNGATLRGNNTISSMGISISQKSGVMIKNCVIKNYDVGIKTWNSALNYYINNSFLSNSYEGILFDHSGEQTVQGNYFYNNSYFGLYAFWFSSGNVIDGNIFENNPNWGIVLDWGMQGNTIKNNIVKNGGVGIMSACAYGTHPAHRNLYINNTVINSGYGISICKSDNNIVAKNTLINNNYALNFAEPSNNNTFYYNSIINSNNTFQYVPIGNNSWNWNNKGNYWSNYDTPGEGCSDANNDNVCDSPYVLNSNNTDNYPVKASFSVCIDQACDVNRDGNVDNGKYCIGTFNTVYWSSLINNVAFRPDNWGWVYSGNSGEWIYRYGNGWYWLWGNPVLGTYGRFIWMYNTEATGRWSYGYGFNCDQTGGNYGLTKSGVSKDITPVSAPQRLTAVPK